MTSWSGQRPLRVADGVSGGRLFEDGRLRRRPSLVVQRAVKSRRAMASGAGQGRTGSRGSGCRQNGLWLHRQRHHTRWTMTEQTEHAQLVPVCRKYRGSPTAFQRSLRDWCGAVPPPRQVLDCALAQVQKISDARPDAATVVVECRKRRVSKNSTAHDQRAARGLAASLVRNPSLLAASVAVSCFDVNASRNRGISISSMSIRARKPRPASGIPGVAKRHE